MKMNVWYPVLTLICVVVTFTRCEEITIRTPTLSQNSQDFCVFPDFLSIDLLRPGLGTQWSIRLKQDNVLPLVRSVYLMKNSEPHVVEEHHVVNDGHDGLKGFHNHTYGAAFTVKCSRNSKGRQLFLLEGSIFLGQQKFRVTPSLSWQQRAEVYPSYTINVYVVEETTDFLAGGTLLKSPSNGDSTHNMAPLQTSRRHKRAVTLPANYTIDVLTVIDYTLYNRFFNSSSGNATRTMSAIVDYLNNLFTAFFVNPLRDCKVQCGWISVPIDVHSTTGLLIAVNMRMSTLNLQNRTLKIRLIPPVFLTNSSQAPYNSSALTLNAGVYQLNAPSLLSQFKQWLTTTKNLASYDHAMFITATGIIGGTDSRIKFNITKGLANVNSLCRGNGESSSIIEDRGASQSEGVVAHELAHSFGSLHDGENNTCDSAARYIMSDSTYPDTNANIYNPWIFSACSSESILKYLKTLEQNETLLQRCLIGTSGSIVADTFHTVSADDQCKRFYGNQSFVCRGQGLPSLDRICDEFFCRLPGTEVCERMTAATGTCCGSQKKCVSGLCVDAAQGECPVSESCPFGDQPGIVLDGKTCAQLDSSLCYSENVYLKCCATCAKNYISKTGCNYGDKVPACKASECGSYFRNGTYGSIPYSFVCCKTCPDSKPCSDDIFVNVQEVLYPCNEYIFNQGNRAACYQKSILDGCCKSCEDVRNATSTDCPWGDKSNCTSLLKKNPGATCTESLWQECCYTCDVLRSRVPQTTKSATTQTTKSATTPTTKQTITTTLKTAAVTTKATAARTNSTQGTTNGLQKPATTCNPKIPNTCRACMHVIGVQMLCILLLVHTGLVNWFSS